MANGIVSTLNSAGPDIGEQEIETKLIEGSFRSEQAKSHVLGVLGKSIQHHMVQSFKGRADDAEYSYWKMSELTKARDHLADVLEEAEKKGLVLNIEATLKVSATPDGASEKAVS